MKKRTQKAVKADIARVQAEIDKAQDNINRAEHSTYRTSNPRWAFDSLQNLRYWKKEKEKLDTLLGKYNNELRDIRRSRYQK